MRAFVCLALPFALKPPFALALPFALKLPFAIKRLPACPTVLRSVLLSCVLRTSWQAKEQDIVEIGMKRWQNRALANVFARGLAVCMIMTRGGEARRMRMVMTTKETTQNADEPSVCDYTSRKGKRGNASYRCCLHLHLHLSCSA